MRKPTRSSGPVLGADVAPPCGLSAKYPSLWHFLADDQWDDGSVRVSGTVTLLVEAGRIKAALNDRDGSRSAFISSDSLETLLGAVDTALEKDRVEWRPWRDGRNGRRT